MPSSSIKKNLRYRDNSRIDAMTTSKLNQNTSHPVYSDYSHLASLRNPDIGGLAFVAGLRETNGGDMIARILPMTKIIPIEYKAPRLMKLPDPEKPKEGTTICMRDECVARRNMYVDLKESNKDMKMELEEMKQKVVMSGEGILLEERGIVESEERNNHLKKEIENIQNRIQAVQLQVSDINTQNESMRVQLGGLRQEVEKLSIKTKEAQDRLNAAVESKCGPSVVFSGVEFKVSQGRADVSLANEVLMLGFNDDDSDDD